MVCGNMGKTPQTITDLVKVFADSVIKHGELMLEDSVAANCYYRKFVRAMGRLSQFGDDGLLALAGLLDDGRAIVRVTAACYLLNFRTGHAVKVLKAASTTKDRGLSMLAIVSLKRWEDGIYLDPATGKEVNRH